MEKKKKEVEPKISGSVYPKVRTAESFKRERKKMLEETQKTLGKKVK